MARRCSTICLPIGKDDYLRIVDSPTDFRRWIDQAFRGSPELFPKGFAQPASATIDACGQLGAQG